MIKRMSAFVAILAAFVLVLFFFSAALGQDMNPTPSAGMPQDTATALPVNGSANAMPVNGLAAITTTMSCPMMSGSMAGTSGMGSMGTMNGMQGMGSMMGMQGMGGMSGATNMSSMQGMGITGMTSGMTGLQGSGVSLQLGTPSFSIYTANPWILLGWLVLFLVILSLFAALVLVMIALARRLFMRRQPVMAGP